MWGCGTWEGGLVVGMVVVLGWQLGWMIPGTWWFQGPDDPVLTNVMIPGFCTPGWWVWGIVFRDWLGHQWDNAGAACRSAGKGRCAEQSCWSFPSLILEFPSIMLEMEAATPLKPLPSPLTSDFVFHEYFTSWQFPRLVLPPPASCSHFPHLRNGKDKPISKQLDHQ